VVLQPDEETVRRHLLLLALCATLFVLASPGVAAVPGISAGYQHNCVVIAGGAAKCWGRNDTGQLGDGSTTNRFQPTPVSGLSSGVSVVAAGGGFAGGHTCAVMSSGTVKCWGTNHSWGQVGDGTTLTRTAPVDVTAAGQGLVTLSAGARHTCAVVDDGELTCWGDNFFGQLGNDFDITGAPTEVPGLSGVVAVSSGGSHTCALSGAGGVKCWGYAAYGQLGDNTFGDTHSSPVDVVGLQGGVAGISAGGTHTCALTTGGGVKCWGDNSFGQLGDGTNTNAGAPVDVTGLASGVIAISAGGNHTCAVTAPGGVKCWGANYRGQLGIGSFDFTRSTPADVTGLSAGSAAIAAGYEHSCAVSSGGGVKCWGDNAYGQLGDGSTNNSFVPVNVAGFVSGSQVIDFAEQAGRILGEGPFALSATASSGLAVAFTSLTPSVCTVSGNVVTPLAAGTCTIAANQPGDAIYLAAPEVVRSIEIRVLLALSAPVDLTAVRVGDSLNLKWRVEPGFDGYEVSCDGGATIGGRTGPVVVTATTAVVQAPVRTWAYRCRARAVRTGEITAPGRPAFSLAYALQELGYNGSLTVGDFDGNGLPEVLGTLSGPDGFKVVSEASLGLGSLRSPGRAYRDLRIADLDGDGYDDIIANVYSSAAQTESFTRLYWGQAAGGFVEDLAFAARRIRGFGETILIADFNNDGHPDIFIPFYTDLDPADQNVLLINDGNRGFAERADELGVANRNWSPTLRVEGAQALDFDGDGWIDIYTGSHLYKNNGGTFTDVRESVGLPLQLDEGAKFVDWNRDGRMDLVLQPIDPTAQGVVRLFEYNGSSFVERSSLIANVPASRMKYGFFAADFNGDGTEDLVFPGGFDFAQSNIPPMVLINRGDGFEPTDFLPADYRVTFGSLALGAAIRQNALVDIFLQTDTISYLKSLLPDRPFVRIEVLDAQGHRNQHGRVVTMIDPDPRYGRVAKAVDGGSGYMSQSDYPVTFAIPEGVSSVQVEVRFKSGTVTATAPAGGTLQVYEDGRAVVRPVRAALTIAATGTGSGSIGSNPSGIRCGDSCYALFDAGTAVTLAATPDSNSTFGGWTGACTGTASCTVTMDAAKSVTATFGERPRPAMTLGSSLGSSKVGQAVTFTATLSGAPAPTGTVVFRDGSVPIAGCESVAIASAQSACTTSALAAGTHPISASYGGDAIYLGADSNTVMQTVERNAQLITFAPLANRTLGGLPFTLSATASSGLEVTFISLTTPVCTVSGNTVSLVSVGVCTIAADQAGSPAYFAAPRVTQSFGVNLAIVISRLVNLASRMQVGTADKVSIGGFVIGGSVPKTVVVRARGPSLSGFGVVGALANPILQLVASADASVTTNDDWPTGPDAARIQDLGLAPADPREAAIIATLNPGLYTAVLSGAGGGTGVGIVEVFEVDHPEVPLVNIAARGQVLTGEQVMIGGFVIQGDTPQSVVVRARGPSLAAAGVTGVLANPVLQLVASADGTTITNDDWRTDPNASALQSSGFAPSDDREAALLVTLNPGAYTAIVSGAGGTTGVAIVEVFAR
jgi:alpha-tubulin suppressor-like RCC1 family protein